jgi:hypothetical protein
MRRLGPSPLAPADQVVQVHQVSRDGYRDVRVIVGDVNFVSASWGGVQGREKCTG